MSLGFGREYVAIPGPSVVPDRVLRAMHRASPNIYDPGLEQMVAGMVIDLKSVARTRHNLAIYIANGHGAWEAALANTLDSGDKILILATGMFAKAWGEIAAAMGLLIETMDFGLFSAIDQDRVSARLKRDDRHEIKAILTVQVDTSTSVRNGIEGISEAIRDAGHPALFMVDCIGCLACDEFRMDEWNVDVMVAASQKGLMTPPGLGLVFFNDRAKQRGLRAGLRTSYWDWNRRSMPEVFYQFFCGTAPTHHLFGLREALYMLVHEEGLDAALARHTTLAGAVWAAVDTWSSGSHIMPNVERRSERSHAVTTIRVGGRNGKHLQDWVRNKAGLTLGIGLAMSTEDFDSAGFFRIGHMGHVNAHMVLGALAVIESGFKALKIPIASGGLTAAASVCADA